MPHISTERLAALVDGTPLPDEAAHLAVCAACTGELGAQRRLLRLAAQEGARAQAPISDWSAIATRLKAEDVIRPPARGRVTWRTWAVRVAAGVTLFAGGTLAGRASAGVPFALGGAAGGAVAAIPASAVAGGAGVVEVPVSSFRTTDEAVQVLSAAQRQYQEAASYLAAQDTSSRFIGLNQDTYRTRLAALDEMASAARAALYRAPQDPVINQYYLSAMGAREATLRQIGATMPAERRLERY